MKDDSINTIGICLASHDQYSGSPNNHCKETVTAVVRFSRRQTVKKTSLTLAVNDLLVLLGLITLYWS